jgi:hypothetical protein
LGPLDRAAKLAIEKHQRLMHNKVLELVLGDMIAMDTVHEVRQKLKLWYDHLEEFDKEDNND